MLSLNFDVKVRCRWDIDFHGILMSDGKDFHDFRFGTYLVKIHLVVHEILFDIASFRNRSDVILVQIYFEVLENWHLHLFAISVTAFDDHLGLPSPKNLAGLFIADHSD